MVERVCPEALNGMKGVLYGGSQGVLIVLGPVGGNILFSLRGLCGYFIPFEYKFASGCHNSKMLSSCYKKGDKIGDRIGHAALPVM